MNDPAPPAFRLDTVHDADRGQSLTYVFADFPGQAAPVTVCVCAGPQQRQWAKRILRGLLHVERRRLSAQGRAARRPVAILPRASRKRH